MPLERGTPAGEGLGGFGEGRLSGQGLGAFGDQLGAVAYMLGAGILRGHHHTAAIMCWPSTNFLSLPEMHLVSDPEKGAMVHVDHRLLRPLVPTP